MSYVLSGTVFQTSPISSDKLSLTAQGRHQVTKHAFMSRRWYASRNTSALTWTGFK
ncbi:hypothetical protein SERLADRAFT_394700 [Serpula lacrymans var. lacrymans S7.9]|uniref:Uncharacterized protein n=1 Tax=Serpula lacrymans var. lacrymans (strain S7.9) TaxID=578457 RepID=F8P3H6_SERL9|nr:uncharacterized protein SERLADRAFT_394700 [Serpula lacrymans var. lacrymans S7.9]EGO22076.1 hypothetical protein SERLADRAFT_394700 [Serpula lacrymans var. lacrymans S7.9]